MNPNKSHRNRACAYCGIITGQNTRDHVIQSSIYPSVIDRQIQRPTVSCCEKCNLSFHKDEAHFRAIVTLAGPNVTPERREQFETVIRGIQNPTSGANDFRGLAQSLKKVNVNGKSQLMVYPGNDARVIRIVKKVIRGLLVFKGYMPAPIAEEQIKAFIKPDEFAPYAGDDLTVAFHVPNVVTCEMGLVDFPEDPAYHSAWRIRFYETEFWACVDRQSIQSKS